MSHLPYRDGKILKIEASGMAEAKNANICIGYLL